ncbi:hypothetical protein KO317_01060 [Candidatus Micrarchaeota archaeon]|nr:hypothetical protein [Candidatus Micrarchaeota archaeon]
MPVIIYSKINIASTDICEYIIDKYKFNKKDINKWEKIINDKKIEIIKVDKNVVEFEFKEKCDYLIVPSTHRSESNAKSLCVHVPGNWSIADLGGERETLNVCYASKMKTILLHIKKLAEQNNMIKDWEITLEVDHHGPTTPLINSETPILFVEIGSNEKQWNDQNAISLIGDSIIDSIIDDTYYPAVLGFGGGHYATKFNRFELNNGEYEKFNYAIAHILPKYRFDDFEKNADKMFKQALEKNVEKIEKALIDWKGLRSTERKLIVELCEKNNLIWEKV